MLDDLLDEMESCLSRAIDHLAQACRDACSNNVLVLEPLPTLYMDVELMCDPGIGNTANFYEDFLGEAKAFLATLLSEFQTCAIAACKFDALHECRLYSDILIGSDDDSDDASSYSEPFGD